MTDADKIKAIADMIASGSTREQVEAAHPGVTDYELVCALLVVYGDEKASIAARVKAEVDQRLREYGL